MSSLKLSILADSSTSPLFEVPPEPFGVVVGPDRLIYFGDVSNHRVFRLSDLDSPKIEVIAGNGDEGYGGDGGHAQNACMRQPYELRFDTAGNLVFVDMLSHVVRRIDINTQKISTIAGTGEEGFSGDGGAAATARLSRPHSIEVDASGALFIADIANHRIRRVDQSDGHIATFAGTGEQELTDVERVLDAANPVNGPRCIAFLASGDMILGLREGNAIYRIDMTSGRIVHIAGNGLFEYTGDGGNAIDAGLCGPKGIAIAADGAVVIADTESHTVRRIDTSGKIETLVGNGEAGDSTDPRKASLNRPHGVFVEPSGAILIGDSDNRRLLRLSS